MGAKLNLCVKVLGQMLVYYKSCKKQNGVAADVHSSHQEKAFTDHSVSETLTSHCIALLYHF